MEPWQFTAREALDALAAGRLSVLEYATSCLQRIRALDDTLNAWTCVDEALVLAQARKRDTAVHRGVLHGIPVGFKDIIDTADLPTEYFSAIYKGHRPRSDASCVAITRKEGGIVMGKTATTEFAYRKAPRTCNPHDPAHTPGGSSSGSAVAVAAGMVPIAVGSQTGGSTIRPASYCGVVGYKPTFGVINRVGVKTVAETLDHVGVMARTVEDVAMYVQAVAGMPIPAFRSEKTGAPRVGLCRLSPDEGDAAMFGKLEHAAATLAARGAMVHEVELHSDFATINDDQMAINDFELARSMAFEYENHRDLLSPLILQNLERGWNMPREQYANSLSNAAQHRQRFADLMRDFDILLTPSAAGEAPEGLALTGTASFNRAWSLLGVPCVTIPAYTGPKGLPIGMQIVGAHGADTHTLKWADWALRQLLGE